MENYQYIDAPQTDHLFTQVASGVKSQGLYKCALVQI